MAVRDDDPIDATLEGAPIPDDTGESSEVLWASVEAPAVAVGRGAPPPVTMPDMPPLAAPPMVPKGPAASSPPPRLTAPPTQRAAATVVARLADVIGSDGISFDASEADGEASGFEDGATRPDVARHAPEPPPPPPAPAMRAVPRTPTPAPRIRPAEPPPDFDELKGGPPPSTLPPSTLPPSTLPPPALPRRETRGPMAGLGLPGQGTADGSLPSPPSSSSSASSAPSLPRRETRGPMAGASLPGAGVLDPPVPPPTPPRRETRGPVAGVGGLDPPLPPSSSTPKRSETRGPVAGVGGLDPPVAPKGARPSPRRERPVDDAPPVSATPPSTGGGRGVLPIVAAVIVIFVVIVAMSRGGGGSIAGGLNPRDARTLADRARASLAHKARSDVEDPVRGIARSIVGEGARVLVLRDKAGDAWLLPDGGVVVTDGLLRRLSSDAQLAAVIAHLTAHHELGHIGALSVDLDGPAVLAASAASAGVDEEETDVRAAAVLVKSGWRARALVEAEDALGAGPWAARHKRLASKIVAAVGPDASGREDKDWYERQIRSVLGAP